MTVTCAHPHRRASHRGAAPVNKESALERESPTEESNLELKSWGSALKPLSPCYRRDRFSTTVTPHRRCRNPTPEDTPRSRSQ
jgi:hypothetical protein